MTGIVIYEMLGCQYEVNHNTHGADSSTNNMINDKTLGLYLVCYSFLIDDLNIEI